MLAVWGDELSCCSLVTAILFVMARTTVKATYSLSPEVVQKLERLASGWRVSKSEALARAITAAEAESPRMDPVEVLNGLQQSAQLDASAAQDWAEQVRRERHDSGTRRW